LEVGILRRFDRKHPLFGRPSDEGG
jgi:hypothetical protein